MKTRNYLRPILSCCIAHCLGLAALPALAAAEQTASYKDWYMFSERDAKGVKHCILMAGGNGIKEAFFVDSYPGGYSTVFFEEFNPSGGKYVATTTDEYIFQFDDAQQTSFDDVRTMIESRKGQTYRPWAVLNEASSADAINLMRSATTVSVLRKTPASRTPALVYKFSLAGFTALFLKASEWCGFDANRIPRK